MRCEHTHSEHSVWLIFRFDMKLCEEKNLRRRNSERFEGMKFSVFRATLRLHVLLTGFVCLFGGGGGSGFQTEDGGGWG